MCKICTSCESIMNYDPYFEAEVCVKCGKMERKKVKKFKKLWFSRLKELNRKTNFGSNGSSLNMMFNRTMVLQCLDHIRRMGIDQSFK